MKRSAHKSVMGFALLLLLLAQLTGWSQSAQLKKMEYAFNADPGLGNGIAIKLPAVKHIDSLFKFDVSGLPTGIHLLFFRVQDTSGKWSITNKISFFKFPGNDSVTTIKRLEFAFNTDPGIGKGILKELPGIENLDKEISFDVSGLPTGIHVLFFRVQDNAGKWSLTNRTSFFKFPGNDSTATITQLEYFLDTDPGYGNATAIPFIQGKNISDTFDFTITDNGALTRNLYVRAKNNSGAWSLLYIKEIEMCQFFKTKANFNFVRYSDRYAFTDSSKSNFEQKYLWKFGSLSTDTIANPVFEFPRGNHNVTLITGQGCRKDTVEKTLYVTLENYYPNKAQRGADIIMRFFGGSLDTNVTVELSKGGVILKPYKKAAKDFKQLIAFFDLHTAEAGNYNVRLKYADGFDTTIVNGLVVNGTFTEPDIEVTLDGPAALRRNNEWTYYTLTVSNRGNSLAKGVPFWVVIPNEIEYIIDSKILAPPGYNGYPVTDSIPQYVPIDSMEGKPFVGRMYLIIAPYIDANESFQFRFRLRSAVPVGEFTLHYGCDESMWGSPMKYIWSDCFDDLLFLSLNAAGLAGAFPTGGVAEGAVLVIDGFSALGDLFVDNTIDVLNGEFSGYSFMQSLGNAVLSATGLAAAKKLVDVGKIVKGGAAGTNSYNNFENLKTSSGSDCWKSQGKIKKLGGKILKQIIRIRNSFDPNQITGPVGFGDNHYINGRGKLGYIIDFENLPTAGAAAQKVFITDTLDKTIYNLQSFELGSFRIGDSIYKIPSQRNEYTTTVDLRPGLNLLVRFNAKLDTATGILALSFASLDPVSKGEIDAGSLNGFLPPNTTAAHPAGNGSISFSVPLKDSINHNEIVSNQASIVFDRNSSLLTNNWTNKIDKVEPVVTISDLRVRDDTTIVIHFSGTDDGAGIQSYGILVSTNAGKIRYLGNAYADSIVLLGKYDSSYKIYIMPIDHVSNVGDSAFASTVITSVGTLINNSGSLLRILPNPNKGKFIVQFVSPVRQKFVIEVYNMLGQKVATLLNAFVNGETILNANVDGLNNGLYIIKGFGNKGFNFTGKIVIER